MFYYLKEIHYEKNISASISIGLQHGFGCNLNNEQLRFAIR